MMNTTDDVQAIDEFVVKYNEFKDEIAKVIVGQDDVVQEVLISIFCNGHCLLVGVPGLAKTLLVQTIADSLGLSFNRIQFTPDLMPSDITGTDIIEEDQNTSKRSFRFFKGPIFANVILADEINRTPPKTQSALLQAMQEHNVTAGGETYTLDEPFFVLATQNPIEQEGTYPLPEAQVDRFMLKLRVVYPGKDEERAILKRMASTQMSDSVTAVVDVDQILKAQNVIDDIYVDEKVEDYVLNLVFATRDPGEYNLGDMDNLIEYGASPRATINLVLAAKARAFLQHRGYITPEDVRYVGRDVLRHRVILTYEAEAEELTSEDILQRLFDSIEIP